MLFMGGWCNIPNIILLAETKESSNLAGTLGAQSLRNNSICQAWNVCFTLLHNRESEDSKVIADNAASNGFALALTGSSGSVAGVALGEEEFDSSGEHLCGRQVSAYVLMRWRFFEGRSCTYDTLLHGKALLVIAACDAQDLKWC